MNNKFKTIKNYFISNVYCDVKLAFRKVEITDAETLMRWRRSSRISNFMISDISDDLNLQKKWISNIDNINGYYPWIVELGNVPIAFIYLEKFNIENKTTSWGYYLGDENYIEYAPFIPGFFYKLIFDKFGIEKINIEVFYNNLLAINLHLKYGYHFNPRSDRVIYKNNTEVLLLSMSLYRNDFDINEFKYFDASFELGSAKFNFLKK